MPFSLGLMFSSLVLGKVFVNARRERSVATPQRCLEWAIKSELFNCVMPLKFKWRISIKARSQDVPDRSRISTSAYNIVSLLQPYFLLATNLSSTIGTIN